jgi:hypothetical protein
MHFEFFGQDVGPYEVVALWSLCLECLSPPYDGFAPGDWPASKQRFREKLG